MSLVLVIALLCSSTLVIDGSSSFATLSPQAGYKNLLVTIADDVPSTDCVSILNNVKAMIQDGSAALHKATEGRASFGDVTILIPDGWRGISPCIAGLSSLTWPRRNRADILVYQDHPLFGGQPFTFQHGTCGMESRLPIQMGVRALPRGIDLVHEWFHYRYGVFDEVGVNGDSSYPPSYQIISSTNGTGSSGYLPTSCTNVPLKGQWIGNQWENSVDNMDVTSSIMYTTKLAGMDRPCDEKTHQKAPPTKHNWHCAGQSVSEIIFAHRDFNISSSNNNQSSVLLPTNISIASNPVRGYHVILDVSPAMNASFKSVKSALSQFIWFLPDGLSLSIDTFSAEVHSIQPPAVLNYTIKNSILDMINTLPLDSQNTTSALVPALNHALEMFRLGLEVILITSTSSGNYYAESTAFRDNMAGVHILSLTESTFQLLNDLTYYGGNYFIPNVQRDGRNGQSWMADTLHSIYSRTTRYRAKIREENKEMVDGWNNGTFQIESPGRLFFSLYNLDDGNGLGFQEGAVFSPSGIRYPIIRPTKIQELYQSVVTTAETGNWSYAINTIVVSRSYLRMDIRLENGGSNGNYIRVESWTSSSNSLVDWSVKPIGIFAHVTNQQRQPISGLSVTAKIVGIGDSSSYQVVLDENNPADVTKGDGIYSAVLVNFPRQSTAFAYVVEILDSTGTLDLGSFTGHPSAGSLIPTNQSSTLPFLVNGYAYGGSFGLTRTYSGQDTWPPARIRDLRINWYNSSMIELVWTAPKDNLGLSNSFGYKFNITGQCDLEAVQELFYGRIQPAPGSMDRISKIVPLITGECYYNYFTIYAEDDWGNRQSLPSNIVTIYGAKKNSSDNHNSNPTALPDWLFWLLIGLACLCVILIILVTIVCCYLRRKKAQETRHGADWVKYGDTSNEFPKNQRRTERTSSPADSVQAPVNYSSSEGGYSNRTASSISEEDEVFVEPVRVEVKPNRQGYENRVSVRSETSSESSIRTATPIINRRPAVKTVPAPWMTKKVAPNPPPRQYFYSSSTSSLNQTSRTINDGSYPLAASPSNLLSRYQTRQNLTQSQQRDDSDSVINDAATVTRLRNMGIVLSAEDQASLV